MQHFEMLGGPPETSPRPATTGATGQLAQNFSKSF